MPSESPRGWWSAAARTHRRAPDAPASAGGPPPADGRPGRGRPRRGRGRAPSWRRFYRRAPGPPAGTMPAMSTAEKLMIVGLDCVPPEIVFDDMRAELPVLSGLMERGAWGKLESCDPPITVPAWSCMMSSKDPGTLGFYGFRNRKDHSYDGLAFATSEKVRDDRLWDILSRAGKHVVALGVPQTFPPRQVNGEMVSCFLTPSTDSRYTYPEALKEEIREVVGDYMVDVPDYRTDDRERVVRDIHTMTERRFALARHLRDTRPWDFFMLVEMGPDRLHHALWRFYDPNHPDYVPGTPLEAAFRDYYRYLDSEVGSLI